MNPWHSSTLEEKNPNKKQMPFIYREKDSEWAESFNAECKTLTGVQKKI